MVRKFQKLIATFLFTIIAIVVLFSCLFALGNLPKYAFGSDFYLRSVWLTLAMIFLVIMPVSCGFTYGFSILYVKAVSRIKSRWVNPF